MNFLRIWWKWIKLFKNIRQTLMNAHPTLMNVLKKVWVLPSNWNIAFTIACWNFFKIHTQKEKRKEGSGRRTLDPQFHNQMLYPYTNSASCKEEEKVKKDTWKLIYFWGVFIKLWWNVSILWRIKLLKQLILINQFGWRIQEIMKNLFSSQD